MRNFTLGFFLLLTSFAASSQNCPTPNGMIATGLKLENNCFMYVINAIPQSNVYIFSSAHGQLGTGVADAQGRVLISYNCASGPVSSVLSLLANGDYCDVATISQPITLPVKWSSFNTKIVTAGVQLSWSTSYEFNNEKFFIEKSTDGRNYEVVGEVAGAGNALETQTYAFTDGTYTTGSIAYYRIRQVDIDKSNSYSKVAYVNTSKNAGVVKIFPNPFVNEIQLTGISAADLKKANVQLFTVAGTQVKYEISGSNAIRINDAPSGVYILTVNGKSYKLLKN